MHASAARALTSLLGLASPPVGVAFVDQPPPGVARVERPAASGCTYWKVAAAEDRAFYTVGEDHHGCPVGAHTHAAAMPAEKMAELQGLIGTMVGLQYLRAEEVAGIPTRDRPLEVAVYARLEQMPVPPDVVLVAGRPRALMLLAEAAAACALVAEGGIGGRPTCAMIPAAMATGKVSSNLGCIGNRVYTDLPDDAFYAAIPARALPALLERLDVVVRANTELEGFHRARRSAAAG